MLRICSALTAVMFFGAPTLSAAQEVALGFAVPEEASPNITSAITEFSTRLAKNPVSPIAMKVLPTASPLQSVLNGEVDIALVNIAELADTEAREIGVFQLPFFFRTLDEVAAVQASAIGDFGLSDLSRAGLVGLGYWNAGMVQFFGKPVADASSLKGIVIAGSEAQISEDILSYLGAEAAQAAPGDWSTELAAGRIDNVATSPWFAMQADIAANDIGRTISEVNYLPEVYVIVLREDLWEALPYRVQVELGEATAAVAAGATKAAVEFDLAAIEKLKASGFQTVSWESTFTPSLWLQQASGPSDETVNYAIPLLEQIRGIVFPPDRRGALDEAPSGRRVAILFVTDRLDEGGNDPEYRYGSKRGDLSFGRATVVDQNGDYSVADIDTLTIDDFADAVEADAAAGRRPFTLFVHGFSTKFTDGLVHAARLSWALESPAVGLLSWPSDGVAQRYPSDEDEVELSRDTLVAILRSMRVLEDPAQLQILAYSMGGRLVTQTADYLSGRDKADLMKPDGIIFAAPDIYSSLFSRAATGLLELSKSVILYASAKDSALGCSALGHENPRAGLAGPTLLVMEKITTVDVSAVEDDGFTIIPCTAGHGYLLDNPLVQADLKRELTGTPSPNPRRVSKRKDGLEYWELHAD